MTQIGPSLSLNAPISGQLGKIAPTPKPKPLGSIEAKVGLGDADKVQLTTGTRIVNTLATTSVLTGSAMVMFGMKNKSPMLVTAGVALGGIATFCASKNAGLSTGKSLALAGGVASVSLVGGTHLATLVQPGLMSSSNLMMFRGATVGGALVAGALFSEP